MGFNELPLFSFSGHGERSQTISFKKRSVYLNLHSRILSHGLLNLIFMSPCELEQILITSF